MTQFHGWAPLDAARNVPVENLDLEAIAASLSAADLLTLIKTVDGAGSGLDADLLDGQSSATFATAAAVAAGYQPLDSDLTDIAALTTTSWGRALLALANAGDLRYLLSVGQLERTDYIPGSGTEYPTTSLTLEAVDATNLSVTFTAPASGKVKVTLEAQALRASSLIATVWGVIDDSGTVMADNLSTHFNGAYVSAMRSCEISGLTAGASYTFRFAHRVQAAGTGRTFVSASCAGSITVDAVP